MDVTLVGSYPPPHGGQSVHVRNLARYLRTQAFGVQVVNTGSNKKLDEAGVTNVDSAWGLLVTLLGARAPTVIHVHVSLPTDWGKLVPIAVAAKLKGIAWIVTVHSGGAVERLKSATPLQRFITRMILKTAARVICVNANIQEHVSPLAATGATIMIAPHSVDPSTDEPPPVIDRFMREHQPVVSCIGQFEPVYGFDDAVRLMATVIPHYPNSGLLLIGNERNAEGCSKLIAELGLRDHVMICGNLPHEQCLGAIRASDLFLRPTRYDGDALSVREALAMGVPVVASATDFRPEGTLLYRRDVPGDLARRVLAELGRSTREATAPREDNRNLERISNLYSELMSIR
jgi:glycosyltransferase involved in cell wall biosynthesis